MYKIAIMLAVLKTFPAACMHRFSTVNMIPKLGSYIWGKCEKMGATFGVQSARDL